MKTLFRVLGAAAAVAVTGAAIVVLDKVLNDKDPLHVENVEFPEEAEKDPAEAEKTAEAYAEGEAKETTPGDAWPPAFEKAPAEPETAPAAPVVEAARAEEPAEEKPAAEETTVNPVEAALPLPPRMRTASSIPPRLRRPAISPASKRNQAARAEQSNKRTLYRRAQRPFSVWIISAGLWRLRCLPRHPRTRPWRPAAGRRCSRLPRKGRAEWSSCAHR